MKLHEMKPQKGARKKPYRKGIGDASAGRGEKGSSKREGFSHKPGFEGGQTPLYRRIPKRGFNNYTKINYDVINLDVLIKLDFTDITPQALQEANIYKPRFDKLKILGGGEINKKLNVKAHAFSKNAQEAIEKAGGKVEVLN